MKQRPIDILSNDNTLFCTGQCNNRCIMCCQPPTNVDDINSLYDENIERIYNAPKDLSIIGITGGEPTLLGGRLVDLIKVISEQLPNANIHILSNGREFKNNNLVEQLMAIAGEKIVFGIPLHSDNKIDHDIIAGAKGAFEDTMSGLYNLASNNACIELRIVMNRLNYKRFYNISEFIYKNVPFVAWIAFMGMEYTGYAVKHNKNIWIEPNQYVIELYKAIKFLSGWNYDVCIYNIPLCLLPSDLHEFAEQSISDWKNDYQTFCTECLLKSKCCGSFTTSIKPYNGLHSI